MTAQEIIMTFGLTEGEMTERLEELGYDVDDLDSAVYSEFRNIHWYSDFGGMFLVIDDIDFDDLSDDVLEELKSLAD